jgi:hypothetical protein
MDALYEYMLDWSKGSKRRHIDGERSFIERYIRRDEFEALFGGEMLLADPSGKSEFIGVWGRKAIRDFKRTLRERGAGSQCSLQTPAVESSSFIHRTRPSTVTAVKNPNC